VDALISSLDIRRSKDVVFEVVAGQAVLIDRQGRELLTLNAVGTVVWQALDGMTDQAGIVRKLSAEFSDVNSQDIERDVSAFITELRSSGLLEDGD
jgi:hypothetical protein